MELLPDVEFVRFEVSVDCELEYMDLEDVESDEASRAAVAPTAAQSPASIAVLSSTRDRWVRSGSVSSFGSLMCLIYVGGCVYLCQ